MSTTKSCNLRFLLPKRFSHHQKAFMNCIYHYLLLPAGTDAKIKTVLCIIQYLYNFTIGAWKVPHYANLTNRGSQKLKRPLQISQRPKKELIKTQQIHKLQRANLLILNFGRHLWDFGVIFSVYKIHTSRDHHETYEFHSYPW